MIRKSTLRAQSRPKPKKKTKATARISLAETKAHLDRLKRKAPTPKAAKLIALMREWLDDESGYDEEALPELMKALDAERDRVGARRLFDV